MATATMRMKWLLMGSFSRQRGEVYLLMFILLLLLTMVSYVWQAGQLEDGSSIDLSDRHMKVLIDHYKAEKEFLGSLKDRQRELNRMEGHDEDSNVDLLEAHVPKHKDTNNDWQMAFNISKHLPLLEKPKVKPKEKPKELPVEKPEKKVKYVKFYDPSQGRIVMKPAIMEDTELQGGVGYCREYDITPDISEDYECVHLRIKPVTPLCIYPNEVDRHISVHIRAEGIWEPHIVRDIQNVLYGDPDLGLIDIGANIGQYSLLAARMGHKVVAVEPFIDNIKHLQMAAHLGNVTDRILVLQNAISDRRASWYLKLNKNNQGGVSLQMEDPNPDCISDDCTPTVLSMHMDDLLEVLPFQKAVIKIDIEGHEHRAFLHSSALLDKIYVPYIYMEWIKLRQYHGAEIHQSEDKTLTQNLVKFLIGRGYHPYSSVTMEKVNADWWVAWTDDIVWKHEMLDMH